MYKLSYFRLDEVKSPLPHISKAQDIIVPQENLPHPDVVVKEMEQPNIDLQISLKQRWPGFNTLLIDIAPYWLLVNDTQFNFVIVENSEQQYYLPSVKTFAPPHFKVIYFPCI